MRIEVDSFATGSVVINYAEVRSAGAPLVLLHGGSARWQAFDSILSDFAGWHIYAPDLRGHGRSGWVPGSYRLQDYAADIVAFLRHVVKEPAFLFGHSLGGIVGLMVAAQYPVGVRALAVGDAPLTAKNWHQHLLDTRERIAAWRDLSGGQKSMSELLELLKDSPTEVPGEPTPVPMRAVCGEEAPVFSWLATNLYQSDPDLLTALLDRFEATASGYEMDALLPAIECPVLLLQADPAAGGLMGDREIEQAQHLLARPAHVRLDGISHVLHNERKEPVVAALKAFFGSW